MSEKFTKILMDEIVITGMSGRFPESDSTDEFAHNLYKRVDMITEDSRRWPPDMYGMSARMAKLKDIDKFDALFFGIMDSMADTIDPQSRILLETTYEAIIDSGINPQSLRSSQTGVYIGYSSFGMPEGIPEETQPDSQNSMTETLLWIPGNSKCLYSNRISFVFDFKGPSLVIDTACSSSLVALNAAVNDLRLGKCKQAIVGGTQVCLQPYTNHIFQTTRLNAPDGIPKVWDEKADGFVRGETVCCLFLQRKSDAKRIYATVLNSGVNIDGNKRMGMFFPSSESQEELMIKTYEEANVDPLKLTYFEAHATGTKVGDQQEAKAIYNAYYVRPKREEPLPIGLLKSNVGHSEGASGVSSVTKVLLAFENQCIASNLYLKKMKSGIAELWPMLSPINDNLSYTPGIAAINNFGIGGVNAHLLIEPNYKTTNEDSLRVVENIPRIVNICSRTEEAFHQMCQWIEDNPTKVSREFLALLTLTMKVEPQISSSGFPIRGSLFIKKLSEDNKQFKYEYKRQFSTFISKTIRKIWFVFPGLGGQWVGMAKALMPIKIFADKIEECHKILKPYGIDLRHLLLSDDKNSLYSMTNKFCATTAIEIALFDVMTALNIIPDGIIGHSFGEIAAAYADRCLTTEEALLVTYYRGVVTESDKQIPKGLMAVIGMSWNEAKKLCPKGVSVVCNNGKDTVVVSGLYNETKKMVEELSKKGVFVRELQSSDIPYHSEYLSNSAPQLTEVLKKCVPNPILRTNKWLSTALLDSDFDESLRYASAEYFVHNLISPVYFYNKIKHLPLDAIVVEVGPHSLFSKSVKETLDSVDYISLMKKDSNDTNLNHFLNSIARLYELGINPSIESLYPRVEWPVPRGTQSISSLMRWNHKKTYFVRKYPDYHFRYSSSDMNETIDLSRRFNTFLPDHCIDGNLLFPATGYLMLAWRQLAASKGRIWNQIPVIFEDVQFRRAVFLSDTDVTRLKVKFYDQSGEFVVLEHNKICCCGTIRTIAEDNRFVLSVQKLLDEKQILNESEVCLTVDDIYKDLGIGGYDYGPFFRGLQSIRTDRFRTLKGTVLWDGNWITFTDALLQSMAVAMPLRKMMVPVMIKSLRCDPLVLYEAVKQFKVTDEKEQVFNEEQTFNDIITPNSNEQNFESESDLMEIDNKYLFEGMVGSKFHMYRSVLPFYANVMTRMIVTHGLEIEDLMAIPITRKTNVQDLKLEYYRFVANEDMNAIEESHRIYLNHYLKVCLTLALKVKDILGINGTNYLIDCKVSEEVVNNYLIESNENHILLKIFNRLLKVLSKRDLNQNIKENKLKQFITEIKDNKVYDLSKDVINKVSKNELLIRTLLDIVSENNVPKKDLKVLEINLRDNLMAKEVDNHLASFAIYPIDVDYTIAVKSIDSITEDYKNKSFKLIEWNPNKSVFPSDITPKDLVILNFTEDICNIDIKSHLQEVYDVIVNKGFMLCIFRYKLTEPEIVLNTIIGEKTNKSVDYENQIQFFTEEAKYLGFSLICSKTDSICSKGILLRKTSVDKLMPPKANQVFKISGDCNQWFEELRQRIQFINENDIKDENIWLISNEPINGIIGLINCLRLEPGGETIRCVFDFDNFISFPIDFKEKYFSDILTNDLAINVLKDKSVGTFRHLTLPKEFDKTESNEYFLNVGQNKDLSSLQWFNSKNMTSLKECFDINNRKIDLINCKIYSSGLNFRDVMLATGRISSGAQHLFTDCVLGLEFAGRRTDSGERVMGFDMSRCFATSIDANSEFITHIPDHWSMDDGVTVLSTYSTVWYGLIQRAHLQRNESILIHSGAGGVGQSAITVCQYYGCDIFVTVGTEEKKKFLMNEYNIPENRIFSSRDIQFKFEIKEMTEGKGVDLVLNSLTGDKLEASYECLADCGRFVEIGKYDLQMNKKLGMFSFLKDISFIGVSVDQKLYNNKGFAKKFFDWMHENSTNGCIKPINRTVFAAEEAEKAFRYMTTGKHIGKIIIKIREEENRKTIIGFNEALSLKTTIKTYFNPNKVYIITGGLGGIGLEIIHWMLFLGARKFVLTSRYGVRNDYQKFIARRVESLGNRFKMFDTKIVVSTHDTNTIKGTEQLLRYAQRLGQIGGVFHLALVLNDCRFENQIIDKFCETIDSKAKIFENLDKICRKLSLNLDYFVIFSSIVCGKGNAGQSNYGYANSFCERICEARRKDGLHGLAIQWGPIGDVGVLAESEILTSVSGIVKQRVNSCFDILDKLLESPHSVVSCYVRAKRISQYSTRESRICHQIWSSLGIDPKTTPDHLTLGEIGMESMFAVELQQGLERDYDIKVSLNDIKSITIKQLKDFEIGKQEELRTFAKQIRIAREKLSKIKFIIPTESHTRLNGVKNGKPIYFMPPLEGIFSTLEPLAEKIDRPVFGLNWTKDMEKMNSLKEITTYYKQLLNSIHPKGDYDIVGHFYGALIVMEMLKKRSPIRRAVIIDILSDTKLEDNQLEDNNLIDLITKFISKDLPKVMKDRLSREIKLKTDFKGKIEKISTEVKEFVGKSLISKDLEQILTNAFRRAKLFVNYRLNMKKKVKHLKKNVGQKYLEMSGQLLIIKAHELSEQNSRLSDTFHRIRDSYFLPEKGLEGRLNYETVDTNPEDISFIGFQLIANKINHYFS